MAIIKKILKYYIVIVLIIVFKIIIFIKV